MATKMSYTPTPDGIIFRLEAPGGQVTLRLTRHEVAETVTNMCKQAGLPEPWKQN
jgi:hypothetical protein